VRRKILLALVIVIVIPFPQTTVPAWTAQVVDPSGAPQSNVAVREAWQNYTLEQTPHNEDLITNATGQVAFPRRALWRPLISNAIGTLRNRMKEGAKANYGPAAFVAASQGNAQAFTDQCCDARLILRPIR
jgi:hypothetical protein